MEAERKLATPGLGGNEPQIVEPTLNTGVPKPVKKTFAQPMSATELEQRKKGSAVAVNSPAGAATRRSADSQDSQPQITQLNTAKPGSIDPFKQMVKDLKS